MEQILFKIAFPAEFHAQTAVEAAFALHPEVAGRLDEVERVTLTTQEPAIRIIDKTGPLTNPADRDHCLQYMVAVGLITGSLTADDYEDDIAADPRIDALRAKMTVVENPRYTAEYLDPDKRSIANAVQVHFTDGGETDTVEVEYPLGHRRRRAEGIPLLEQKLERNLATRYPAGQRARILGICLDQDRFETLPVDDLLALLAI
jgi:2-methylcitrate dehydratase